MNPLNEQTNWTTYSSIVLTILSLNVHKKQIIIMTNITTLIHLLNNEKMIE